MKKFKRALAALLAAVMLLSCVLPAAFAAGTPTFEVSSVSTAPGETVDVTISIKNNPGIASANLQVHYDDAVLTMTKVKGNNSMLFDSEGEVTGQFSKPEGLGDVPPTVTSPATINWLNFAENFTEDAVFATITFEVSANAAAGNYEVTVTYDPNNVYNIDEDNVYFDVAAGNVEVIAAAHEHNYIGKVTVEATCDEDGLMTYTCECDDSYTEAIPATGHTWGEGVITTEPTCKDAGVMTYTCTKCDETKTEALDLADHTPVIDSAVEATCTETGLTEGSHCDICGAVLIAQEEIPALGHDLVQHEAQAPTCYRVGWEAYETCTRCGYSNQMQKIWSYEGHNYLADVKVTDPTCTEDGYAVYTCSFCGYSYTGAYDSAAAMFQNELSLLGETDFYTYGFEYILNETTWQYQTLLPNGAWDGWVTIPGNYFEMSLSKHFVLSDADIAAFRDYLNNTAWGDYAYDADAHTYTVFVGGGMGGGINPRAYGGYVKNTDGTYNVYYPTINYGENLNEHMANADQYVQDLGWPSKIEYNGMTFVSCNEYGYLRVAGYGDTGRMIKVQLVGNLVQIISCTDNVATPAAYDDVTGKALGHDYKAVVTEPTCTEQGYTTHTCVNGCGGSHVDTYVDALGHDWSDWHVTVEPTYEHDGEQQRECKREGCTAAETQKIPALSHNYEAVVTEPTCTEQGYTTHTCADCGDTYVDSYVPALGHSFTNYVSNNDAACEKDGTKTAKCDRCDATDTVTDRDTALQHVFETLPGEEPTCTEMGYTLYSCTKCDFSYKADFVDALGHDFEIETTEPTCTEMGVIVSTCKVCRHVETRELEALGHEWFDWTVTTEPTCTEAGEETRVCANDEQHVETREIEALGHTEVIDEGYNATCTETGLTEGKHCEVCEEVLVQQTIIPATGHVWGDWTVVEFATTETEGKEQRVCANDGAHVETLSTPKLCIRPNQSGADVKDDEHEYAIIANEQLPMTEEEEKSVTGTLIVNQNKGYKLIAAFELLLKNLATGDMTEGNLNGTVVVDLKAFFDNLDLTRTDVHYVLVHLSGDNYGSNCSAGVHEHLVAADGTVKMDGLSPVWLLVKAGPAPAPVTPAPAPSAPNSPKTSDGTPVVLWSALLVASFGGGMVLLRKRKEEE